MTVMQVFNAIFLLVLAGAGYVAFLTAWVALVFLFRLRRRWLACVLSLPVYVVVLFGWVKWQNRPATVFEHTFGFPPTADVRGLESDVWALGDSGTTYLRFKASPTTVARIVARGLTAGTSNVTGFDRPPPGWNPASAPPALRYEGSFSGRAFASEVEVLIYDPTTGDVWFHLSGVD